MLDSLKILAPIFFTIFLAEMGDKTQLATLLFSADGSVGRWGTFLAASLALIAATAIGVLGALGLLDTCRLKRCKPLPVSGSF